MPGISPEDPPATSCIVIGHRAVGFMAWEFGWTGNAFFRHHPKLTFKVCDEMNLEWLMEVWAVESKASVMDINLRGSVVHDLHDTALQLRRLNH